MSYRYILRYYIDPHFHGEERLEELVRFCETSQTEEVMLFLTPEELSPGHPTWPEIEEFIGFAKRVKQRLAAVGVELSLNPWTTLYQVPRGRRLRDGQNFRRMVGETGAESPLVACPLCSEWQEYLSSSFALMAREIQPVAIWIEDDWRLHNHGAELGWGGCFCKEHMRLFSEMVGQEVSRSQLLNAILQPGKPHPWREQWLELSRRTILEPAQKLCDAIRTASPVTRTALMSSLPDQHSAEGRDWRLIQQAIGDDHGFMSRPHMPPYTEQWSVRVTPNVTRQTIACLDPEIQPQIYPELENSPRCGIYSKSGRYTVFQMLEAALFGSRGITINHFDMLGNGVLLDRRFESHLAAAKPVLNAIEALKFEDGDACGVQVLFSTKVANAIELEGAAGQDDEDGEALKRLAMSLQDPSQSSEGSSAGKSVQQLVGNSVVWGSVCTILGISHRYTTELNSQKGPILVAGQTLRALAESEIVRLLSGRVFLDADAVQILIQRGFANDIGIKSCEWRTLLESGYAYEEIHESDPAVYGLSNPRVSAQRCADRILKMQESDAAEILSSIYDGAQNKMWPATIVFKNGYGGEVVSLCYPMDGKAQFFMGYFNEFRREFMQRLFAQPYLGETNYKWAVSLDGTRCYALKNENCTLISVLNSTDDDVEAVKIRVADDWFENKENPNSYILNEDGEWQKYAPQIRTWQNGVEIVIDQKLRSLQGVYLMIRPGE